ncbi:MAG: hypothetical protein FWC16_09110 [Defluviitaleaceae bacterium]|nr:hypothetical protein [Defluviitaleaceae bacterium]MCL2275069.1 hypothetical protein [Defluviitaleaceae bacterium]
MNDLENMYKETFVGVRPSAQTLLEAVQLREANRSKQRRKAMISAAQRLLALFVLGGFISVGVFAYQRLVPQDAPPLLGAALHFESQFPISHSPFEIRNHIQPFYYLRSDSDTGMFSQWVQLCDTVLDPAYKWEIIDFLMPEDEEFINLIAFRPVGGDETQDVFLYIVLHFWRETPIDIASNSRLRPTGQPCPSPLCEGMFIEVPLLGLGAMRISFPYEENRQFLYVVEAHHPCPYHENCMRAQIRRHTRLITICTHCNMGDGQSIVEIKYIDYEWQCIAYVVEIIPQP